MYARCVCICINVASFNIFGMAILFLFMPQIRMAVLLGPTGEVTMARLDFTHRVANCFDLSQFVIEC